MPLKKAAGNMYSWITHTWNPVRGKCPYECSYCYVGRRGEQKPLHIDEKELRVDLGEGNFIFICSGCDLFHPNVPEEWIERVLDRTLQFPRNRYLLHTKNPGRICRFTDRLNDRYTACVTIETNREYGKYNVSNAYPTWARAVEILAVKLPRMITVEPIMDFDTDVFAHFILNANPVQVNIGADSGWNGLPEPSREKVEELIERLAPYTKIDLKTNLRRILPESRYYGNA
ncbi:MAG: phage Gp37/Gp68 family protein [Treponema sp.]|jgi:DNA repair photolyase|nr:phage Gp37/Gp68 family protein [Treponema sp.]